MISIPQLQKLITRAVVAGAYQAQKARAPKSDVISQSEARRILVGEGFKGSLLDELEARGMLHPVKGGSARNSRWKYSLTELQLALTAIEAGALINSQQ